MSKASSSKPSWSPANRDSEKLIAVEFLKAVIDKPIDRLNT